MFFDILKAIIILGIIGILIWLLTDVLNRPFQKPLIRVIWFLILTFIPVIGMIAYYFLVKKKQESA